MVFVVALSTLIFSVTHIIHIEGPVELDFMMSFILLVLAMLFAIKKDILMVITSALLFSMLILESFQDLKNILELATMSVKIVAGYIAISAWIYYYTGHAYLPTSFGRNKNDS